MKIHIEPEDNLEKQGLDNLLEAYDVDTYELLVMHLLLVAAANSLLKMMGGDRIDNEN